MKHITRISIVVLLILVSCLAFNYSRKRNDYLRVRKQRDDLHQRFDALKERLYGTGAVASKVHDDGDNSPKHIVALKPEPAGKETEVSQAPQEKVYLKERPPERDAIYRILREETDPDIIAAKIRPLYKRWGMDYELLLRELISKGYRLVPYEDFDPAHIKEKVVYLRHDIHYRDIIGAAGMMDIEHRLGARASYFIQWDYSDYEQARRDDFVLLKKLSRGEHRFGLHSSFTDEYYNWSVLKDASSADKRKFWKEFPESEQFKALADASVLVPDSQWGKLDVFPAPDKIESKDLRDLVIWCRERARTQLASMRETFGEITTLASHGGGLGWAARVAYNKDPKNDWRHLGPAWRFLDRKFMKELGLKWEPYQITRQFSLYSVTDNSGIWATFRKQVDAALAKGEGMGILIHPAQWERNILQQSASYRKVPSKKTALAEQVLFDEMDFYDHPAHQSRSYPSFSPERVRRINSYYYLRTGQRDQEHPFSGRRYGEIELRGDRGSLMYLPRAVDFANVKQVKFLFRKSDPKGKVFLRLYKSAELCADQEEGQGPSFNRSNDSAWHEATVPVSQLKFTKLPPSTAKAEPANPMSNLQYYDVRQGDLYALEFGMTGSKPGQKLFIDRITLVREAPQGRVVRGMVTPPVGGLAIEVNTPDRQLKATTAADGSFEVELPESATRYEVLTRYKGRWFLPQEGRYFEVGTYLPAVHIVLKDEIPESFATHRRSFRYEYHADRAISYASNSYFLYAEKTKKKKQEFLVESSSNAFGYLDRDRRIENPDGARRVFLVGPCYIAGQQIDSTEHLASQVEAIFRFHDEYPIEVMPASHNTHVLLASWPVIRNHAFAFKPDLIINDFVNPGLLKFLILGINARERGYDPKHPESYHFSLDPDNGKLVHAPNDKDWLLYRLEALPKKPGDGSWIVDGVHWINDFCRVDPSGMPPLAKNAIDLYEAGLRMFVSEGKQRGVRIGVLNAADIGTLNPRVREADGIKYDTGLFPQRLRKIVEDANAIFIDGSAEVKDRGSDETGKYMHHWRYAGHWSPLGHRLMAEAISKRLRANTDWHRQGDLVRTVEASAGSKTSSP